MINIREVKSSDDPYFEPAMKIFESSFPSRERHSSAVIKSRLDKGLYRMFAGFSDGTPTLIALFWALKGTDFILFDYIAVAKPFRGKGFGSFFMKNILRILNVKKKFLIFEVEDPDFGDNREEREKRVRFYKHHGAKKLQGVRYILPPLSGPGQTDMILMMIPGHPDRKLPGDLVKALARQIYKELYDRDDKDPILNTFINKIPKIVKIG